MSDRDDRGADRRFEAEIEIRAARAAVWDAVATPDGLCRWLPADAEVEPGPGGRIVWRWGPHYVWPQTIEVWEPGVRLRTRYDSRVADGPGGFVPLFVDLELRGEGGTTTLRLVQSGFGAGAEFDDEFDGISRGWPVELQSLRLAVERHAGVPRALAWRVAAAAGDPDAAWQRLIGPDGFALTTGAGDAFRLALPGAGEVRGRVISARGRELAGVAASHGDGFLRIAVERGPDGPSVWLWLATYGRPAAEPAAIEAAFDAVLARALGPGART